MSQPGSHKKVKRPSNSLFDHNVLTNKVTTNTGQNDVEDSHIDISTFSNDYESSSEDSRSSAATGGSTSGVSSQSLSSSSVFDSPFSVHDPFQISSAIEKVLQKNTEELKAHFDHAVSELKDKMDDISQRLGTLEVAVASVNQTGNSHPGLSNNHQANANSARPSSDNLSLPDHSSRSHPKLKGDSVRASKYSNDSNESVESDTPTDETTSTHKTSKSCASNVKYCGTTDLQLQHTDIRASQYSTNSDDSVKSDNPTEVTTTSNRSEEVSDNVTVKMESFATGLTEQNYADQSSVEEFTATVPGLMDSASITNGVTNFEIPRSCNSQNQLIPLIVNNEAHFVVLMTGKWLGMGAKNLQGYIESYNLLDGTKYKKTFSNCKRIVCPSVILYQNKVTILAGSSDTGPRSLYQFNCRSNSSSSWDSVLNSKPCPLQLELQGSLCVSYEIEKMVNVNILHLIIQQELCISLTVYLFSSTPMTGKYWRSANIRLPNVESPDGRKYKIQSGVIFHDSLYCSLLLPETKTLVCKVDMGPLQQCITAYEASNSWSISDSLLTDCFLTVFDGECVAITFKNANDKTVMELRRCSQSFISSSEYQFEFPSVVKVLTASVLLESVIVVYHDARVNQCLVKKIIIY